MAWFRYFDHILMPLVKACGAAFGVVLGLGLLLGWGWPVFAAQPAVNPQAGSVGLSGTVRGPAPKTAAVILSPGNGSHTSNIPVTVTGTCSVNTFVSIEKNQVFGGAAPCDDEGRFSLQVDLFDGLNLLVAKVTDALGQPGPDSQGVTVFYDAPSFGLPGGTVGKQMYLQTGLTVAGGDPGRDIARSITIVGGVGPYAVSWDWGDGKTTLISQVGAGEVRARHAYEQPGTYQVIVRVTDSQGNSAFLQMATVVNGPVEKMGEASDSNKSKLPGVLVAIWPLAGLIALMVAVFWLGERRQARKIKLKNLANISSQS